jgi:glutathione S-transferase
MGDQFTAADVVTGSLRRWGMGFGMIPKRPALVEYVGRLSARPALKRAQDKDQVKDEAAKPPA